MAVTSQSGFKVASNQKFSGSRNSSTAVTSQSGFKVAPNKKNSGSRNSNMAVILQRDVKVALKQLVVLGECSIVQCSG